MATTELAIRIIALFMLAHHISCAGSNLRGGPAESQERVSKQEVQRTLLEEINEALNVSNAHQATRIVEYESELATMYESLPKNEYGSLGHTTVHYALHRLFVERHCWSFRGLEPGGGARSSMTPAGMLKDRVPAYLQELFEGQLGGQGFALRELAVLAATLEHLVNNEAQLRVSQVFHLLELPLEDKLTSDSFEEVLDSYMVAHITKVNLTAATLDELRELRGKAVDVVPEWPEVRAVVDKIAVTHGTGLDFDAASIVAAEVGKSLGVWHKGKCQSKKDELIALGDQQVGRIPLSNFYAAALSKPDLPAGSQVEHIDYLRELGALDESVQGKPSVLVPNYLMSPSNCFTSSPFYSICCANECEGLMRHLELEVAAPAAKTTRIQQLVSNLPSSTVSAPRELPASLLQRLDEIAAQHGGDVPIHGRLFSQWLHHAYPRECPYPHTAGTTRPQTADEWLADTGKEATHTREELEEFIKNAAERDVPRDDEPMNAVVLPWSDDEELLVVRPASWGQSEESLLAKEKESPTRGFLSSTIRVVVFASALSMMSYAIKDKMSIILPMTRPAAGKGFDAPKGA